MCFLYMFSLNTVLFKNWTVLSINILASRLSSYEGKVSFMSAGSSIWILWRIQYTQLTQPIQTDLKTNSSCKPIESWVGLDLQNWLELWLPTLLVICLLNNVQLASGDQHILNLLILYLWLFYYTLFLHFVCALDLLEALIYFLSLCMCLSMFLTFYKYLQLINFTYLKNKIWLLV